MLKSPPKSLKPGEPRAARWHKVNPRISLPDVRRDVNLPKNFQWRPYAADLTNWKHGSYYQASKLCFFDKTTDQNLQSYIKCLCGAELVGLEDCKERYLPHRVAMQFGIDQDLPGDPAESSGLGCTSGAADDRFFVPAWSFEPNVTARYSYWWGEYKSAPLDAIKDDVKVAIIKIKEKDHASMGEKNLKMHKVSTLAFTKSELENNLFCAVPVVPRKSNFSVKTHSSAAAQFPKKIKKDSSADHSDGCDISFSKQRGCAEKRLAFLRNASTTGQSTNFVSSQSLNSNENVKKRKLATPTEEFPATKKYATEYTQNLRTIATKGIKGRDIANVQNNVTFRMEHEHKMRAKVSEKCSAKGGKKAMAEGSLKNPMAADGHKVKQSQKGAVKEVKRTMENARTKTQEGGLLMRVKKLEKLLGIDL